MSALTLVKPYDEVFDGQRHYRTLLQSTARPGTIGLLDDVELEIPSFFNRASALTALALFSDDVTFYVSSSEKDATAFLYRETGAKAVPADQADFLILGDSNQLRELRDVRLGTLIYPETSVTAIVQVEAISPAPIPGSLRLTLTGPGIETETVVFVLGLLETFLERRAEVNCEFPIGVDCFLTCDSLDLGHAFLAFHAPRMRVGSELSKSSNSNTGRRRNGYVAVKGGQDAIENANKLVEYFRWKGRTQPIALDQARTQMRLAIDRAMGEGSLYAPEHAALVLLQVEGDSFEAAFHLRAYRATLERRFLAETLDTREMFVHRRISSTFRDIPGGQILGPTRDYSFRLLNPSLLQATLGTIDSFLATLREEIDPAKLHAMTTYKKVIDVFLHEGLMSSEPRAGEDRRVMDVTREAIKFPVPRSGALQMLARAETGALMCMAYSTMRGFGESHGTVGEMRVGDVPVRVVDRRGRKRYLGKIKVTEAEMVGGAGRREAATTPRGAKAPKYSIGYGLCFGQNETKAICMGMVESALRSPNSENPANNQEFVLYHTEVIESYGFTNHLKLPHYVTFQAGLESSRREDRAREQKSSPVPVTVGSNGGAA